MFHTCGCCGAAGQLTKLCTVCQTWVVALWNGDSALVREIVLSFKAEARNV